MGEENEILKFNISGHRFETFRRTLEKYPETLLGSKKREVFYNSDTKEYFINRDPVIFRNILNYYITGNLHYAFNECLSNFDEELSFFGILSNKISDCCYDKYQERKNDNTQRLLNNETLEDSHARDTIRQRMWIAFENPHTSTIAALVFHYAVGFFIAVSLVANIVETIPYGLAEGRSYTISYGERYHKYFFILETVCVMLFTIEFFLELYAAPSRWKHLRSFMSVVDIMAIMPFYIDLFFTQNVQLSAAFLTLRVFRLLHIFKFSEHSGGLRVISDTLKVCAVELGFLLWSLSIALILFASAIFYAEMHVHETNFTSIPAAAWCMVGTMTTLGYGNMVPETIVGKIVGGISSLSGVVFIALSVSIIVSNYHQVYRKYERADKTKAQRVRLIRTRITKPSSEAAETLLTVPLELK